MDTPGDTTPIDALPTQPMHTQAGPVGRAGSVAHAPLRALLTVVWPARRSAAGGERAPLVRVLVAINVVLLIAAVILPAFYAFSTVAPLDLSTGLRATPSPQSSVTPAGTPDPHSLAWAGALHDAATTAYINDLIAHMSLDEEVGQMLVTDFVGTDVTPELAAKIQQYHIGGAILYNRNYYSATSLRTLTTHMQADAKIPLFIAIDQEGGTVDRMAAIDGPDLCGAECRGNRDTPDQVRQIGAAEGHSMASVGVNVNLAPVVDVQNVPDGQTYMQYRMFGWTPDKVTTMAGAYLDGLQSQHVIGTLKHFPGLGDVGGNPHDYSVTLTRSLDDLNRIDWAPYRALIASGQVGMIMTTHVIVTAKDKTRPTTVSPAVTTGILRDQLGFQGVIITDDIYMGSLMSWSYSLAGRIIGCVQAGDDLIASVFTMNATIAAEQILHDAVTNGTISKARIDESVRRILLLKLQYGMLKMPQV